MIVHTEGIVLRTLPYQDAHLIVTCYTQAQGKVSFLVRGARSSRNSSRAAVLQPLYRLDLVYSTKPGRDLQTLTEMSLAAVPARLTADPVRCCYGLLLAEVVNGTQREEEADTALYAFLNEALAQLDQAEEGLYPLFLHRLVGYTRFLGFGPTPLAPLEPIEFSQLDFDSAQGVFSLHPHPANAYAAWWHQLLTIPGNQATQLKVPKAIRKPLLNSVLHFYQQHVDGFRLPRTLGVFEDMFQETG